MTYDPSSSYDPHYADRLNRTGLRGRRTLKASNTEALKRAMEGLSDAHKRVILNKWHNTAAQYTVGELIKDALLLKRRMEHERKIQLIWEKVKVNNLPKEDPLLRNFNNRKAIKVSWKRKGKTYSNYYTPESILGLIGIKNPDNKLKNGYMYTIHEQPMNRPMFFNPTTRNVVFRRNVKFVIMEKRTNQKTLNNAKIKANLNKAKRNKNLNNNLNKAKRNKNLNNNLNKAKRNKNLKRTMFNKMKKANLNNTKRRPKRGNRIRLPPRRFS